MNFGLNRVPGEENRFSREDGAFGRGCHQAAIRREQVDVEGIERDLRQVVEVDGHLPGHRIRMDRADELGMQPEAVDRHEQPVLVVRLGFTDVDRSVEVAFERRRVDRDRPDLGLVGTFGRPLRAEVRLRIRAGALPVGGVRVDCQAFGRVTTAEWSSDGVAAKPRGCGMLSSMSRPDGRIRLGCRRRGVEDGFEGLFVAVGGRRIGRVGVREMVGVLVGLDIEADRLRLAGARRRVVGKRVNW